MGWDVLLQILNLDYIIRRVTERAGGANRIRKEKEKKEVGEVRGKERDDIQCCFGGIPLSFQIASISGRYSAMGFVDGFNLRGKKKQKMEKRWRRKEERYINAMNSLTNVYG